MTTARIILLIVCFFSGSGAYADALARLIPEYVQDCGTPCSRSAVIFVHGITGTRDTWVNSSGGYWPAMLSNDSNLKSSIDVYRIDYDGGRFTGPAVVPIGNSIDALLDSLILLKQYTKIAFIAHSLGGNIVRSYLIHVTARYGHAALSRFRIVVTLGTPYEGSSLTTIAELFSRNDQIRVLRPIDVNDFQQILNKTEDDVQGKHESCPSLRNFAAFEKVPEPGIGIVVSEASATRGAYQSIGFDKTHIQLSKPVNEQDLVYSWTSNILKKCVGDDDAYCPQPARADPLCLSGDFR